MTQNELVVNDGLVTVTEAGKFLSLSRSTLYQMMDRGELQFAKIGGSRRIPKQALKNLARECLLGGWKLPQNAC
jgi:excisionase family DNA binding protein